MLTGCPVRLKAQPNTISVFTPLIPLAFPDGTNLTFKDISAASEGSSAIAVYSTSLIPGDTKATSENLVDALVYTCETSTAGEHLDFLGPSYAVPCKDDR